MVQPDEVEIRVMDLSYTVIDSIVIMGAPSIYTFDVSNDGKLLLFENLLENELSIYNLGTRSIEKSLPLDFLLPSEVFQCVGFLASLPVIVTTRAIYVWHDAIAEKVSSHMYNGMTNGGNRYLTTIVTTDDTCTIFNMSWKGIHKDYMHAPVPEKFQGEYLSLKRFSSDTLDHIGFIPPSSDFFKEDFPAKEISTITSFHLNYNNKLGVIFNPENKIHLYNINATGYTYDRSVRIPIKNWTYKNIPDLNILNNPVIKGLLEPEIFLPVTNNNTVAVNYFHQPSEAKILDQNVIGKNAYEVADDIYNLLSISTMIYKFDRDQWYNLDLGSKLVTVRGILSDSTYLVKPNPTTSESTEGTMFYVIETKLKD